MNATLAGAIYQKQSNRIERRRSRFSDSPVGVYVGRTADRRYQFRMSDGSNVYAYYSGILTNASIRPGQRCIIERSAGNSTVLVKAIVQ